MERRSPSRAVERPQRSPEAVEMGLSVTLLAPSPLVPLTESTATCVIDGCCGDLHVGWRKAGPVSHQAGFFDDFCDFATNDAHLNTLAAEFPDHVEIVDEAVRLIVVPVLNPDGYASDPSPDDDALLAQAQVDAVAEANGTRYIPLQGADLYPAAGALDDWAYGELGLMSFASELRPSFEGPGDFVVVPSEIGPACDENVASALVLMQWASGQEPSPGTTGVRARGTRPARTRTPAARTARPAAMAVRDPSRRRTTTAPRAPAAPPPGDRPAAPRTTAVETGARPSPVAAAAARARCPPRPGSACSACSAVRRRD